MPPLQKRVLDASAAEGVEEVGDVAAVDALFARVDAESASDGELFVDEAAAGAALGGVAWWGIDAGEADGLAADD